MVTPRKFTGTEWHALACGARVLARMQVEAYEQHKSYSNAERYLEFQKLYEELAELCDYWGDQADLAAFEASKAESRKRRESERLSRPSLDAAPKKSNKNKVLKFRLGPS